MNNNSYFYILWKTFLSSYSAIVGGIDLGLGFVFWMLSPDKVLKAFPMLLLLILLIFIAALFAKFSTVLYTYANNRCTVLKIIKPYGVFKEDQESIIALITNNDYFVIGGIVSVFIVENGFEKQIALGEIINIQEDKKVQLRIFRIMKEEISKEQLLENNIDVLKRLKIKPIIKLASLEVLNDGK